MDDDEIKKAVREGYAEVARAETSCCSPFKSCRQGPDLAREVSTKIGYENEDLENVPEGANLGLGCGNPVALASLREGETVLDLGSGAGFDCFLAAQRVGRTGRVIGVDMTPEMLEKARENARKGGYENVEFRPGEVEHLPVADASVDVIISNCVINLVPDKKAVFKEAFRVLRPGGRLLVSDIVLEKELPGKVRDSVAAYVGCLAGAILKDAYIESIREAGFATVEITGERPFPLELTVNDPAAQTVAEALDITPDAARDVARSVVSVSVSAVKG